MKAKNVGIGIESPKKECTDKKCPFHSDIKLRGFSFSGKIVSMDIHNSCSVEWQRTRYIPKYERYEKRKSKVRAHIPKCLEGIKEGDTVKIHECRPLSKTINFIVVEKDQDASTKVKDN
ncbi:30S ribosomal protein S17 [Candidatus Woesearchaeota archaeon]|nr:30S ribosomal protein S17 [Candidatus Woesearchaeota archaeon]